MSRPAALTSRARAGPPSRVARSEEHTSELQSQSNLVCRLLLEKKKTFISPTLSVPIVVTQKMALWTIITHEHKVHAIQPDEKWANVTWTDTMPSVVQASSYYVR